MALTNNLKKIVDLPIFELCNQTPTATNALSATSTAHSNSRYIYYQVGTLFYRYDIQSDTWQQLASPPVGSLTLSSLKYSADEGYRGNCLGAGASTITIPPLYTDLMIGKVINITAGAGVGQSRTVVSVSDPVILDSGVGTSASSSLISDTTQRWEINQYVGYQCRIVYGQGSSQVRKILYNDANTLYFFDTYYQQLEPWNNTPFSSTSPYAAPIGTLGFQPNYFIESATLTLDTPWTTIPDATSSFLIKSGGVYMISSAAAAPWSTFQYYDVLSDTWTTKTSLGGNLTAALGTDADIEIITKETAFEASTATSGTSRTLVDTTRSMTIDRYCNFMVSIIGGTGIGQELRVVANGTNYFEVATPWTTIPDATSTYEIHGEANRLYMNGNGTSSMYQYSVEYDAWFTGQAYDFGICRNISLQFQGQEALSINSGNISLTGITSITAIPVNKGFGYAVGDLFTLTTAGAFGKGRVESISAGGVVETVSLYATGYSYGTGTSATTPIAPATGSTTLTVNIATIGKVARITTSTNHNLYKGDTVTIAGCSEAAWNTTYTVFAVDALTQFDLIVTAVSNSNSANANSTTRIVDASKNWIVNEHVGKIVKLDFYGTAPTSQFRSIISNTATTITVATITAGGIGTHRYAILAPEAFGSDRQYNKISQNGEGRASSGSTTTLVDSSKAWFPNQWALYRVRIIAGTGVGSEIAIVGNTATTLTAVAFGFTPDTTTKYRIMDTYGSVNGAGGIVTLATAPIAGGTGYAVGDLLAISTGVGGQARVVAVSGGVVTAVSLVNGGTSGYTAATTYATTNIIGTGTGCTLSVTTITAVGSTTVFYDNTKNWTVNKWAGKRIVFTSSATTQRSEYTIVSNTANSITTAVGLAPDITSTYTILSVSTRSTGISLKWIYGNTEIANCGNNIISLRGGNTNTIDRYNIVTDSWNQSMFFSPQSEIFTTGTMTCYDGVNTVYIHKDATGRILALDVNTLTVDGSLQLTDLHSTATIGNTMELIKTTDGLTFLYIMQHTGTKMWRALIF